MEKVSGFTPSSGELISHLDSMRNNKEDMAKEDVPSMKKNRDLNSSPYSHAEAASMISSRVPINSFSRDENKTAIWMNDPPIYGSSKVPSTMAENVQTETKRLRDQIIKNRQMTPQTMKEGHRNDFMFSAPSQ